jgi:hypothetical protein
MVATPSDIKQLPEEDHQFCPNESTREAKKREKKRKRVEGGGPNHNDH